MRYCSQLDERAWKMHASERCTYGEVVPVGYGSHAGGQASQGRHNARLTPNAQKVGAYGLHHESHALPYHISFMTLSASRP